MNTTNAVAADALPSRQLEVQGRYVVLCRVSLWSGGVTVDAREDFHGENLPPKSLFSGGGLQASGRTNLSWNLEDIPTRNLAGDVYLTTPFTLWGQSHNFLIGADYADTEQTTYRGGGNAPLTPVNIYDFDPASYPEPPRPCTNSANPTCYSLAMSISSRTPRRHSACATGAVTM